LAGTINPTSLTAKTRLVTGQLSTTASACTDKQSSPEDSEEISESPYTIPNALTVARIIACPFLGYQIVQGDYVLATSLLFACGVSDWVSWTSLSRGFELMAARRIPRKTLQREIDVRFHP